MPLTYKLEETYQAFNDLVNMAPGELEEWLDTDESKSVGFTREGESEAVGHKSVRRIETLKRTRKVDLTDADLQHMKKVTAFIKRHRAQMPVDSDIASSDWRYSLMNWGHDPCKEKDVDCYTGLEDYGPGGGASGARRLPGLAPAGNRKSSVILRSECRRAWRISVRLRSSCSPQASSAACSVAAIAGTTRPSRASSLLPRPSSSNIGAIAAGQRPAPMWTPTSSSSTTTQAFEPGLFRPAASEG
jgi:hypothetical protein